MKRVVVSIGFIRPLASCTTRRPNFSAWARSNDLAVWITGLLSSDAIAFADVNASITAISDAATFFASSDLSFSPSALKRPFLTISTPNIPTARRK